MGLKRLQNRNKKHKLNNLVIAVKMCIFIDNQPKPKAITTKQTKLNLEGA